MYLLIVRHFPLKVMLMCWVYEEQLVLNVCRDPKLI